MILLHLLWLWMVFIFSPHWFTEQVRHEQPAKSLRKREAAAMPEGYALKLDPLFGIVHVRLLQQA